MLIIFLEDVLVKILDRLYKEAEEGNEIPVIYTAISAFLEFLNLLNSSGMDNYMKPPSEVESPEDEQVRSSVATGENVDEDIKVVVEEHVTSMEVEDGEKTKPEDRNEPLRRSVYINASTLKSLIKLDDNTGGEHTLSKLEKLIEVHMILPL